jgi:cobalt-zinc-cadmium efflux system membrane fusion protein
MFPSARISFLLEISTAIFVAVGAASAQDPSSPPITPQTASSVVSSTNRPLTSRDQAPPAEQRRQHLVREGLLIKIPEGSPLRAALAVEAVAAKEAQRRLKVNAVVEADPDRTVQVLPSVVGRVVDLKVSLGDRVAQGQELAIVYTGVADERSPDQKAGTTAVPTADNYQRDLSEMASDCNRPESAPLRSSARCCALVARAQSTQQTRLLSLRAPVSGSVLDVRIGPGTVLDDPASSIMTIADLEEIWVTMNLRKRDMAMITAGRPAEVAFVSYPDEVFAGQAQLVGEVPDNAPSLKVRIEFQNPARRLKPNMFALATFRGPTETVPIIPATALIRRNDRDLVFVEVARWTFEARPVEIGFTQEGQTIAISGVNIGERIAVTGGALLED